ncbi:enterotoxin [Bacillus wiedmannii]|uniref:Enterotoxin n=1 Tax=Bacillus wiedmannii TaxID=1890302 RepID=A0A2C5Q4I2_9BACI|nr:non-hemolytic enterotoxin NHE subunit A [Bacillus wiedmannii]PEK03751.1 enterotoxin [Bacillus wiedmannii]PEL83692.1 enterotoxin [Bacillus wiedmannii]PEM84554.1 enterotoxin [Bacillus wiedmannii]PEO84943.1 enterotoxin [Bacillus wiedmannii]PEP32588.1 enterotoxin [Bacillus wiedmannii]
MKKTLITGLLVTAVSTSCFIPVSAYAKEGQTEVKTVYAQNVIAPNTLSNSIRMLGSQSPLIQAYGLVILQQPDIKVNAMSSLTNHQKFAKANVREWIDEYNPKLIDLNQEMMRYSTRFNSYYSKLYELAGNVNEDEQAKADFTNAYGKLQLQVQSIQESMEQDLLELNRFKTVLDKDSSNLSLKADEAIKTLQGSSGDIVKLREDIKRIQGEIQAELTTILNRPQEIIKGSINIGKQVFTITNQTAQTKTIDFVSIGTLSNEIVNAADSQTREAALRIQQKQKELLPLIQKLSQTEAEATQITFVEDQVSSFTELIDRQITTLETLLTDWKVLNSNMIQIQKNVEEGTYTDSSLLQKHFNQIKKVSDEMNKQTNQFEDYVTNVEVH